MIGIVNNIVLAKQGWYLSLGVGAVDHSQEKGRAGVICYNGRCTEQQPALPHYQQQVFSIIFSPYNVLPVFGFWGSMFARLKLVYIHNAAFMTYTDIIIY